MPIQSVNDFVVRFANVNGSGSASANELFARAVLRMGIPVAPRNIFPSNIQGLPTWYEVRISEAGHLGARGGTDLMVAMNPQTWDKDVGGIEPGGYLLYDSTKPMPKTKFREDITVIGVPFTAICNREYTDPRQRQLFKNIIYIGALSALLDMDVAAIEKLIAEQYKGKEKLFDANRHALHLGRDWVMMNMEHPIGLRLKRANGVGDRIFIEGNAAAALGAVYGGATICAWYPITPSSSLAEAFNRYCHRLRVNDSKENRFAIVQAEDELASIGIVIGAGWNGARAFTATSGPGISLMQEFLGLAYFAEIPAVIFDVQRAGPSTGMPTRTQQTDIISCAYASHGDTKHILLFPEDPAETFDFGAAAFDLADRLQTPVFVMMDLDIGMNHRLCRPLTWDDSRKYDRGKVMTATALEAGADYGRYLYRRRPRLRRQHAAAPAQVRDCQGSRAAALAGQCREADQIRRHLFRLDLARDGRGDPDARGQGAISRPTARARLPVPFERDELHRRSRFHLRGRTEPRWPAPFARRQRMRHRSGAAGANPAL
jgi:2-oxoglutarate/2-oxoacid ferredoxin oxidoreductase subunit alpha